ncbi:interferon alpha/beta receptor 1-like [Brienomyrus brachyistius]|uniref:interferon alpha/beta receptor 1-like n=1 Tax=Brienomyrus brachyistius TaxID=42636 RepID=UPI0020B39BF7|nr:interferon alpha/beta receptor 1-like [Brienomyrus brachyistius]
MITHYMLSVGVFLILFLIEGLSLPRLENVTIDSYNLHNVIRWSALQPLDNTTLKYMVQYKYSGIDAWKNYEGCAPTVDTYCSFLPQHPYVNVTLRVQAQAGNHTSPWSQTQPFMGHIQSRLGHPNVTLTPVDLHSLQIEVDPDTNLKKLYGDALKYRVFYGKEHEPLRIHDDLPSPMTITSLEAGVKYCFKVYYVIFPDKRLGNSASKLECVTTEESEKERVIRIAWLSILFVILSGAVISGCIFVVIQNYSKIKESLWPDLSVDSWILEYDFSKIPKDRFCNSYSKETWDRVSVIIENDNYQGEES